MKHFFTISIVLLFLLGSAFPSGLSTPVLAQSADEPVESDDSFDDDLSGFEDDFDTEDEFSNDTVIDIAAIKQETATTEANEWLRFGGFFKEEVGYSYDHEEEQTDFSKIRSTVNLDTDIKLSKNWRAKVVLNGFYDYAYSNHGRDKFTDETLETYELEGEVRDFFIDGAIQPWLRLKFGRQVIAWGESDINQITDLANPTDNRELGMVDLEDSRLPVLATKLSILSGSLEVNLVAIHENRPDKAAVKGSEFDPFVNLRSYLNINEEETPDNEIENTEYLFRVFKSFNGGDISFVWADVYDDTYHLDFESYNAMAPTQQLTVTPRHKRVQVAGVAGNMVQGSWLFKGEFARKSGKAIVRSQENLVEQMTALGVMAATTGITYYDKSTGALKTWSEKDVIQGALGIEYSGFDDITIILEGSLEKIEDYEDKLSSTEISGSTYAYLSYSALNDLFNISFYWYHLTDDNGEIYRMNLDYDLRDALNLSGGVVLYETDNEEATVYPYRNNDRVFAAVKYSF